MYSEIAIRSLFSGAILLGYWVATFFFFRFWKRTGDRFFRIFGFAFAALLFERLLLVTISTTNEYLPYIYTVRLLAFGLIIFAIVVKNKAKH